MLDVYSQPHPFRCARLHTQMPAGESVRSLVERIQPDPVLRQHAHVYIGDRYVPMSAWSYVRPHDGQIVAVRVVPGSGDKDNRRLFLSIVATVATAGVGGAMASAGYSATSMAVAGVATSLAFRAAIDAIAPLPEPDDGSGLENTAAQPRPGVQNARNTARPWQPFPNVLGADRVFPPLAGRQYTEIRGDDQYLRVHVVWGYGPVNLVNLRVGDTPFNDINFPGSEYSENLADGNGWSNGLLWSDDVREEPVGIVLRAADSWSLRTTEPETDEFSVDVAWPGGLVEFKESGKKIRRTVIIEMQYSVAGQNEWSFAHGFEGAAGTSLGFASAVRLVHRSKGPSTVDRVARYRVWIDRTNGSIHSTRLTQLFGNVVPGGASIPEQGVLLASITVTGDSIASISQTTRDSYLFGSVSDFAVTQTGSRSISISGGQILGAAIVASERTTSTVRRSFRVKPGARAQYDVRLRRVTSDTSSDRIRDEVQWTAFRSIIERDTVAIDGMAQSQFIFKATDQLNGVVDRINAFVERIYRDYDALAETWTAEGISQNPATIALDVLQSKANARAVNDARVDFPALQRVWARCEELGIRFNGTVERRSSVLRTLQRVLGVARASPNKVGNQWTFVLDEPDKQVVQTFTEKTLRPGFTKTQRYARRPHALRVAFRNEDRNYQDDEVIVYADGFDASNATRFERLEARDVPTAEQAWSMGRYSMAQDVLRPRTYELPCRINHLVATRGDLVRARHYVARWGLAAGWVKSVQTDGAGDVTGVTVDETLELAANTDYGLRIAYTSGGDVERLLEQVSADTQTSTVVFTETVPAEDAPEPGDHFMFGFAGQESRVLMIKEIGRSDQHGNATLTCVDEAPAVHTADENIPPLDSLISIQEPFAPQAPPTPVVQSVRSDRELLFVSANGEVEAQIEITVQFDAGDHERFDHLEARYRLVPDGDANPDSVSRYEYHRGESGAKILRITGVETGDVYALDVRTVREAGVASPWVQAATAHEVIGLSQLPPNVSRLNVAQDGEEVSFGWPRVQGLDIAGYQLRYGTRGDAAFEEAIIIADLDQTNRTTKADIPPGDWTFFVVALDVLGQQSDRPARRDYVVGTNYGVIHELQHAPDWPGRLDGFERVGVAIEPTNQSFAQYVGDTIDLGYDDVRRVWAEIKIALQQVNQADDLGFVDDSVVEESDWGLITESETDDDDYGELSTSLSITDARVGYEIATRSEDGLWSNDANITDWGSINDSVAATTDWGSINDSAALTTDFGDFYNWRAWTKGNIDTRFVKHRITIRSDLGEGLAIVTRFKTVVDAPQRTERHSGLTVDQDGTTFPFARRFNFVPVAVADVQAEDARYPVKKDIDEFGVSYRVRDSDGNAIESPGLSYTVTGV